MILLKTDLEFPELCINNFDGQFFAKKVHLDHCDHLSIFIDSRVNPFFLAYVPYEQCDVLK